MNYEDLAARLRQLEEAYPEDIFPPLSPEEVKANSGLVSRASAAMARHLVKTFTTPAAIAIDCLRGERDRLGAHAALMEDMVDAMKERALRAEAEKVKSANSGNSPP